MIGLEMLLQDGRTFQLRDDMQTMCLKQFVPFDGELPDEHWKKPMVITKEGWYFLAPIRETEIPTSGIGLEIFDSKGLVVFSSLSKIVSFAGKFTVNQSTATGGKYHIAGRKGNRYGYIALRNLRYLHYKNVSSYIDPITWDEVWQGDIYTEGYEITNDIDGLTFEYKYEFLADFDGYTSPPPDREGSGMEIIGVMVDVSMF